MKLFKNGVSAIIMLLFVTAAVSAQTEKIAPWGSHKGYWVVEGNINSPLQHTVRFYTNADVLVYSETVSNSKLDPKKRKVKMKLKQVLETAVIAWEKNKQPAADMNYVAAMLK